MIVKRNLAEIQQNKKEEIEKMLSKAKPLIRDQKKINTLKENSKLKKFCLGARLYIYGYGEEIKEGCIRIYHIFRIRPNRKRDRVLTDFIKKKLKELKYPQSSEQLDLFSHSATTA